MAPAPAAACPSLFHARLSWGCAYALGFSLQRGAACGRSPDAALLPGTRTHHLRGRLRLREGCRPAPLMPNADRSCDRPWLPPLSVFLLSVPGSVVLVVVLEDCLTKKKTVCIHGIHYGVRGHVRYVMCISGPTPATATVRTCHRIAPETRNGDARALVALP